MELGPAYVGELITACAYMALGVRLLVLAARSGQGPERLLAAVFVLTAVSYVVYVSPELIEHEWLWTWAALAGRVIYVPVPFLVACFTRRVFRPQESWSEWLVVAGLALHVIGVAGAAAAGDYTGYDMGSPWFWLEWGGYTLPFGWAGVEAFVRYRQSRRRRVLGLCSPLVSNRFLLWSLFGVTQVAVSLMTVGQYAGYGATGFFSKSWDTALALIEVPSLVLCYLAFIPPALYRVWVERGCEAQATA
jgi:hypothetical protein